MQKSANMSLYGNRHKLCPLCSWGFCWFVLVLFLQACSEYSTPSQPSGPAASRLDKQELYGDPGLVPNRAGEHARHELALAGEIRHSLDELKIFATVSVQVRLPSAYSKSPESVGHVLVIAMPQRSPEQAVDQQKTELEELIVQIVQAHLGEAWSRQQTTILWAADVDEKQPLPKQKSSMFLVLALSLIIFGASAGITVDRILRRRTS